MQIAATDTEMMVAVGSGRVVRKGIVIVGISVMKLVFSLV
jgi:hypothetical protein